MALDNGSRNMIVCMRMLNKRTQLLLDQAVWNDLTVLARRKRASVGSLVREAIADSYFRESRLAARETAVRTILSIRPKTQKRLDYSDLIGYGRKI